MIKQSKTTIKELTAQYRAVLKRAFFAGIATVAVMSTANAETVTLTTDNFKTYIREELNHAKPNATNFDLNSESLVYNDDGTVSTASSVEGYNLVSGTDIEKTEYSYKNYKGDLVHFEEGQGAQAVSTSGTYGSGDGKTLTYTADTIGNTDDAVLDATLYGFGEGTSPENMITYSLTDEGINSTTKKQGTIYMQQPGAEKVAVGTYSFETTGRKTTINFEQGAELSDATAGKLTEMVNQYKSDASDWNSLMKEADDNFQTNSQNYGDMLESIAKDETTLGNLNNYADSIGEYKGTLSQLLDDSYGQKLSQTLGYDVALTDAKTKLAEAEFTATDFLGAVTENKEAIAKVYSDAEDLIALKEANISEQLGYNVANNPANEKAEGSLVNALTMNEGKTEGKITSVIGAINANTDAIADRTVSFGTTEDGLTFATIADGTNSANVYTKESADAVFAEKQQWVDKTLGIKSKNADAVKEAYAGTNYLGLSTTLTDADIALDNAIKNNANAIDDLNKSMRETDAKLRNDIAALDSKVNDLDENLSAGIASSVALSAVEVSNVKKGEMSVGGGYGNYNSKSAMAFGAALGITDNWSANAGVGLGFGKDTKASFRVGTNYKFKLF